MGGILQNIIYQELQNSSLPKHCGNLYINYSNYPLGDKVFLGNIWRAYTDFNVLGFSVFENLGKFPSVVGINALDKSLNFQG